MFVCLRIDLQRTCQMQQGSMANCQLLGPCGYSVVPLQIRARMQGYLKAAVSLSCLSLLVIKMTHQRS